MRASPEPDSNARVLASVLMARSNCLHSGNFTQLEQHNAALARIMDAAPHGAGIEGTSFDEAASLPDRLVFATRYRHMDDAGHPAAYSHHRITARPSFVSGIETTITGPDRNGVRAYLTQCFECWLRSTCAPSKEETPC